MAHLEPFFPKSHGGLRVDDRRVLFGIIFFNCNGLRWYDAPQNGGRTRRLQPLQALAREGRVRPDPGGSGRRGA